VIGLGLGAGLYALLDDRSAQTGAVAATRPAPPAVPFAASQTLSSMTSTAAPAQANALADPTSLELKPQPTIVATAPNAAPAQTTGAETTAPASAAPSSAASAVAAAPLIDPRDMVAARIDVTQRWVNSSAAGPYSIQLFVADNDQQLRNHLKGLPKFIEMNDIYMYRSAAQGRPMVNVLWGSFSDRKAALDELAVLPASLRANRPYVRTLEGIRSELGGQQYAGRQ